MEEEEGALGLWLTYLLAGVGGTAASYLMAPHTHTLSLGASGAVFGLFMVRGRGAALPGSWWRLRRSGRVSACVQPTAARRPAPLLRRSA